jgi:hypothetical protein
MMDREKKALKLIKDIKDPKLRAKLRKDIMELAELKKQNNILNKDAEFLSIQSDIYAFIRKTSLRMSDNGHNGIVESYAIFFVILWHEFQSFVKFLEKERGEDLSDQLEHLKTKVQEVMDGKGPERMTIN